MRSRVLATVVVAVVALSIAHIQAGGWAVVTLDDLPQQFVVGESTTLKFSVRQHGIRLLPGLSPSVSAWADGRQVDASAVASEPGYYEARLTLPRAGQWHITIDSGFLGNRLTLRPVKAASTAAAVDTPLGDRGLDLFVAKGCNSCHYHADTKMQPIARIGEDLTGKRYSDMLLTAMLTNPSMLPKRDIWGMPDLKLRPQEVAALVAFINKR
jgi:hypothetical protein